jgi:mono/diheme cytochrome c family protein
VTLKLVSTPPEVITPDGHHVVVETGQLDLASVVVFEEDTSVAWLASPFVGVAHAHGEAGGAAAGTLTDLGVVPLAGSRDLGRLQLTTDRLVGAEIELGAGTRFSGTVDGVPFDFGLEDGQTVRVTGSAQTSGDVEILVDLPAMFASLDGVDADLDGRLDGADVVFTNTVAFGAVSSRTYALRTPDPARIQVLDHAGDAEAGGEVYAAACSTCHSQAGSAPDLQDHVAGVPRADTVDVVLNGFGEMPPILGLEPTELADCVAFLHFAD